MGTFIFLLAFLGGASATLTRSLRTWGRQVQHVSALVIIGVGAALIYAGLDPGVFSRLVLSG